MSANWDCSGGKWIVWKCVAGRQSCVRPFRGATWKRSGRWFATIQTIEQKVKFSVKRRDFNIKLCFMMEIPPHLIG